MKTNNLEKKKKKHIHVYNVKSKPAFSVGGRRGEGREEARSPLTSAEVTGEPPNSHHQQLTETVTQRRYPDSTLSKLSRITVSK